MFKELDPILHAPVRLAIISLLIGVEHAEFSFLLENINTTKGNLSFQLSKLKEAGYIEIKKSLKGNYPLTTCKITAQGINAYQKYIEAISDYLKDYKKQEGV